jgi:trk system potassium uptake protein
VNIIIIGAGTLGSSLAEYLSGLEHQISIIERDGVLLDELASQLDVFAITGSGSSPSVLEKAGIEHADIVIAVTPNDETNLLACNFAKQYGVGKRIARLISDEYTRPGSRIDLDALGATHVIEVEKELVNSVIQYIELPGLTDTAQFHDDVYLRGYRISADMPVAGKTLLEIRELAGDAYILVVAIIREGQSIIPSGSERLLPGDETITVMPRESFGVYRNLIKRPHSRLKKIIVSGDSLGAIHIADALKTYSERVLLVDPNPEHGHFAAEQLDKVEVLQGDCTDADMLQEIKVTNADFFISAGKDMEDNIMSCLLAKAEGAHEVIAIRSDDRHTNLFHSLGIDHVVNPRTITLQKIIEHIQILPIGPLQRLKKVNLDMVRVIAGKHSAVSGKALSALDSVFKKEIIVGAVMRDGHVTIPRGDTVIEADDEILVLCHRRSLPLVNQIFKTGFRANNAKGIAL